jgi:adenylate kinase
MATHPFRILMIGPQGSGKGTQAELIAERYQLANISTGVMFREAIKNQTDLGKAVKAIIDRGDLVPDNLTNELVRERLTKPDCVLGFVLDGYPRNLVQAEYLLAHQEITHAMEIWISDEEAVKRISGRRMCSCGMTYHTEYNPPQIADRCNKCGSALFQRDDDTAEAVTQRLKIYHQETESIISFFHNQGIHNRVNGEQRIPAVATDVFAILDPHANKK